MSRTRLLLATLAILLSTAAITVRAQPPLPRGMAGQLIKHFHMQKVPQEGCWFSSSYSSDDLLDGAQLPARYAGRGHPAGNAIMAVETPRDFSALHRLRTDEVWHFYDGSPIDMLLLYPDGHGERITLGPNVLAGQLRQFTVPRGVWQGAAPHEKTREAYSFFADQLSPGFDYADFEIGYRDALQRQYPGFARDIERLTRAEFATSGAAGASAPVGATASGAAAHVPNLAQSRATVFADADIADQTAAPGVTFKELVGAKSPLAGTQRLSVARFTLSPGSTTGSSYNQQSQEVFVAISGSGTVNLPSGNAHVRPGSTVFIPATQLHSIQADPLDSLVFLAISAPAFTPEGYVLVQQ